MKEEHTIEQRIDDLEQRLVKLEKILTGDFRKALSDSNKKKISAKEFLLTKDINSDVEKALVFGYYLEYIDDFPAFNTSDLEDLFRAAKEKLPKNLNDTVNKNISRGFLDEAKEKKDGKKAWYLTSSGERYVESELEK